MRLESVERLLQSGLLKLDVEFGNSHGFFSATKAQRKAVDASLNEFSYEASFEGATLSVTDSCTVSDSTFDRIVNFEVASESRLYDLVSRYVVLSNDRSAKISGIEIRHTNSNIYYQYPVKEVIVPVGNDNYLKISDKNSTQHKLFDNVFYVRDELTEENGLKRWVVHHRMIAKEAASDLILRGCHPKFNSPLPGQSLIPTFIKRKLFRIRERSLPNFPIMSVGEVALPRGQSFDICTRIHLLND